jgi:uncharacterized repeat protein (TIGR01451 family)
MKLSLKIGSLLLVLTAGACLNSENDSTAPSEGTVTEALARQSVTSPDGLLTVTMSSSSQSTSTGVNNTFTWTAHNNSTTTTLTGVTLGSNFGDWCGGFNCTPPGPTLISLGSGCATQGIDELPVTAHLGIWCTPTSGVAVAPGASISGTVTLRPGAGGPAAYNTYSLYNDPVTGQPSGIIPEVKDSETIAPAATDIQITGSASTGSPALGSNYSYTYQIKNSGQWGTFGGITFSDTLPSSLTYVGVTVSPPQAIAPAKSCSAVGQVVTCPLNELQNGVQATITLTVKAPGTSQQIVNTGSANVVAPQSDSNTTNNKVTVTVTSK